MKKYGWGIFLLFFVKTLFSQEVFLLPDQMRPVQILHLNPLKVVPNAKGHKVTIQFENYYQNKAKIVYESLGDEAFEVDFVKIQVDIKKVDLSFEILNDAPVLLQAKQSFYGDKVKLSFQFNHDLSKENIINLFTSAYIWGRATGIVSCNENMHSFCGKKVSIPLINAGKIPPSQDIERKEQELSLLVQLKNKLSFSQKDYLLTNRNKIDNYVRNRYFDNETNCLFDEGSFETLICHFIEKYSSSRSLTDSIESLAKIVYGQYSKDSLLEWIEDDPVEKLLKSPLLFQISDDFNKKEWPIRGSFLGFPKDRIGNESLTMKVVSTIKREGFSKRGKLLIYEAKTPNMITDISLNFLFIVKPIIVRMRVKSFVNIAYSLERQVSNVEKLEIESIEFVGRESSLFQQFYKKEYLHNMEKELTKKVKKGLIKDLISKEIEKHFSSYDFSVFR